MIRRLRRRHPETITASVDRLSEPELLELAEVAYQAARLTASHEVQRSFVGMAVRARRVLDGRADALLPGLRREIAELAAGEQR